MTILTPHQEVALKTIVSRIAGVNTPEPLTYLAGYAGTGKSTILPFILDALRIAPERVTFCAPTGKAAKVMRTKLKAQGYANWNATTIHQAIYHPDPPRIAQLEATLARHKHELELLLAAIRADLQQPSHGDSVTSRNRAIALVAAKKNIVALAGAELDRAYKDDAPTFNLNVDASIQNSELIVVDEASMVGSKVAADLLRYKIPTLAIGDQGQLTPVKDIAGLTNGEPDCFLHEVHRQAAESPIIRLSILAREGEQLPFGDYGDSVKVMKRRDYVFEDSFDERPTMIVGQNKTRWRNTQNMREAFGFISSADDRIGPRATEPVIIKKNVKGSLELVNGTPCFALTDMTIECGETSAVFSFQDEDGVKYKDKYVFQGKFEEHFSRVSKGYSADRHIAYWAERKAEYVMDFNYVSTAHSAQGSEFDKVVVIDEGMKEHEKWLYTAVTRSSRELLVLR